MNLQDIPLGLIDPPTEPLRIDVDPLELEHLADSMRTDGQLQPIGVTTNDDRYTILYGHRRYLAAQLLCWPSIAALVTTDHPRTHDALRQLAENSQRSDLSPMEDAIALWRLVTEHDLTIPQLARAAHRRPEWVQARIELLNLPPELKAQVHTRAMSVAAATALARCTDPAHRANLIAYAMSSGASAHVIAQWVTSWRFSIENNPDAAPPLPAAAPDGARPIVQLPCPVCGEPHDYTKMILTRLCQPCHHLVTHPTP